MIIPAPLRWVSQRAAERERAGLHRRLRPRHAEDTTLDLASNDYLGLARDPRVVAAAADAATVWGAGATGSRLVTGSTELHAELEAALARQVQTAAALVFSSGYLANLGAITALANRDTLIVSDALNHASLIDAIRLSNARVVITEHRNPDEVAAALSDRDESQALVVTDAVFSVDGDLAPLAELYQVARNNSALLLVDEAHSLGVIGECGQGACAAAGIAGEPDVIQTITLSKSLGSQGGAVAAHPVVIDHLIDSARSFIFDTGLAPASTAAALAALQILTDEPQLARRVRQRAMDLSSAAHGLGCRVTTPQAAVLSVLIGEPKRAVAAAGTCLDHGVRVGCFRPPSVPDALSRLRITARATLTDTDIATFTAALSKAGAPFTDAAPDGAA